MNDDESYKSADNRGKVIVQDNALVEASYRLSLYEKRILNICMIKAKANDEELTGGEYTVTAYEIAQLCDIDMSSAYRVISESSDRLYSRSIRLTCGPGGVPFKDRDYENARWVSKVGFAEGRGCIILRFSPDILPYINQAAREFTLTSISEISKLQSFYSHRLYELFAQYRSAGQRRMSIEELRYYLDLGNRYAKAKDLREKVIERAISEIEEKTQMKVAFEMEKTGRKFTHINFLIQDPSIKIKKGGRKPRPVENVVVDRAYIDKHALPGESYEEAERRLKRKIIEQKEKGKHAFREPTDRERIKALADLISPT